MESVYYFYFNPEEMKEKLSKYVAAVAHVAGGEDSIRKVTMRNYEGIYYKIAVYFKSEEDFLHVVLKFGKPVDLYKELDDMLTGFGIIRETVILNNE